MEAMHTFQPLSTSQPLPPHTHTPPGSHHHQQLNPTLQPLPLTNNPPPLFMNYQLKDIRSPHPHDVLCGRGGQSNTHPGNNQWRMLVATNKELYVSLPKKQKMLLSQSIVNAVRSQTPMGRFLQKDAKTDSWLDVGDKRAQEKTSQALREGAPELRTKLSEQKASTGATDDPTEQTPDPEETSSSSAAAVQTPLVPANEETNGTASAPLQLPPVCTLSLGNSAGDNNRAQIDNGPLVACPPPPPPPPSSGTFVRSTSKEQMPPPAAIVVAAAVDMSPPQHYPTSLTAESYHNQLPRENPYAPQETPRMNLASRIEETRHPPLYPQHVEQHDTSAQAQMYMPNQYRPTQSEQQYYEHHSDDIAPPPPTALDPHGDCSFGSMGLISDAGQARLEAGVSFGNTTMRPNPNRSSESYGDTTTDRMHPLPQHLELPVVPSATVHSTHTYHTQQQQQHEHDSLYPAVRYISFANDDAHHFRHDTDDVPMPHPVDGGLEPIGLSFGSVMSMGTAMAEAAVAAAENVKLEGAGLSFGSMMSYSVAGSGGGHGPSGPMHSLQYKSTSNYGSHVAPPDGGLQDIGTSFGSLTLADGDREHIIADAEQDVLQAMRNSATYSDVTPPSLLHQQKSKGNLLDCSDTESEDEETSAGISAQKSADWDKMQVAMAKQIQTIHAAPSPYGAMPPPLFGAQLGNRSHPPHPAVAQAGATFNMPTVGLDREFSQMSAISVGEDFETSPPPYYAPVMHEEKYEANVQYQTNISPPFDVTISGGNMGDDQTGGEEPDLEYTYLNRGNSLASEAFSEAPELARTFDH